MSISIVIPNYNGLENLKKNLPRVAAAMNKYSGKSELIIIDDASNDSSIEYLCKFPAIKIIENPKNLGFAASCNIGVKKAGGDIVILLNSDVYPDEDFLNPLVEHFKDDKVFAVGCLENTLNESGKVIGERGVGKLFFKGGLFQHCAGDLDSKTTDWVCGGSGAFRRDLFLELGGLDSQFAPFYWEDIDLSYRAKKAGYKLVFEKKSIVYHQHQFGSIAQRYSKKEIDKISFDNQIKFSKKHISSLWKLIGLLIFQVKYNLRKNNQK